MRSQSDAATCAGIRLPAARSPRNRTSVSVPMRVASRQATSVTTRIGTSSGPLKVSSRRLQTRCSASSASYVAYRGPESTIKSSRTLTGVSPRSFGRRRFDHFGRAHSGAAALALAQERLDGFPRQFRDRDPTSLGLMSEPGVEVLGDLHGGPFHDMPAYPDES